MESKTALKELRTITGIGKSISKDLYGLGIKSPKDLKGKNPEKLYPDLCKKQGKNLDRCALYFRFATPYLSMYGCVLGETKADAPPFRAVRHHVFRCAAYSASNKTHNKRLLKWWNWKDKNASVV